MSAILFSLLKVLAHRGPRRTKPKMFLGVNDPENRFIEGDQWVRGKDAILHVRENGQWVKAGAES